VLVCLDDFVFKTAYSFPEFRESSFEAKVFSVYYNTVVR